VIFKLVRWRRARHGSGTLTDDDFYESAYDRAALVGAVRGAGFTLDRVQPTSHAFTLWGLGGPFRGAGYYETSPLADRLGMALRVLLPWAFNFSTLIVAHK
jgi:hypothetical protein